MALTVVPGVSVFGLPVGGGDESILLVFPLRLQSGLVPHRDFFTVYGPGAYRAVELSFRLFGVSVYSERTVGVLYHLAIALGLMHLARPFGARASLVVGVSCSLSLLWFYPIAFAWLGGLALLTSSLALVANTSRALTTVIAGFMAGLVPFWRPEMAILLLAAVPFLWRRSRAGWYVVGVSLGLIPLLMHVRLAGSSVFENVFRDRLGINAQTSVENIDVVVWAILLSCVGGIACFIMLAIRTRGHRRLLVSLSVGGSLMMPQAVQRTDIYHALFVGCFILPLALGAMIDTSLALRAANATSAFLRRGLATVGWVALAAVIVVSVAKSGQTYPVVRNGDRWVNETSAGAARLERVIEAVHRHVPSGERVFVGAQDMSRPGVGDMELYYLLPEYDTTFYFVDIAPGVAERTGSRLSADVTSADALVLNQISRGAVDADLPNIGPGDPSVNDLIARDFVIVDREGPTEILLRRPRSPS